MQHVRQCCGHMKGTMSAQISLQSFETETDYIGRRNKREISSSMRVINWRHKMKIRFNTTRSVTCFPYLISSWSIYGGKIECNLTSNKRGQANAHIAPCCIGFETVVLQLVLALWSLTSLTLSEANHDNDFSNVVFSDEDRVIIKNNHDEKG